MAEAGEDGGVVDALEPLIVVGQEVRRSTVNAIAVDFVYVFATAFFATLAVRGLWPAAIAALPLGVMLAFAWMSSRLFFLLNVIVIGLAVGATWAGFVPL